MQWNLKKCSFAIASLALTGGLSAAESGSYRDFEQRLSALEKKQTNVTPAINPQAKNGLGMFATVDALYWTPKERGPAYAIRNATSTAFPAPGAKSASISTDWSWGFCLGLGYVVGHDGWDLYANWTRFHQKDRSHNTTVPVGGSFYPLVTVPAYEGTYATTALAEWELGFDTVDLELGRDFFVSKWLSLRPHIGAKGAWIHQHLHVDFSGGNLGLPAGDAIDGVLRSKFNGVGLCIGLNSDWRLGYGFSFYGDVAVALLYGRLKNSELDIDLFSGSTLQTQENAFHVSRAETDLALGLRWEHVFSKNHFLLSFQFGWEQLIVFGVNGFTNIAAVLSAEPGSLTLQGLTFAAKLGF